MPSLQLQCVTVASSMTNKPTKAVVCSSKSAEEWQCSQLLVEDDLVHRRRDQMLPVTENAGSVQPAVNLGLLPWWDARVCGGMFPCSGSFR